MVLFSDFDPAFFALLNSDAQGALLETQKKLTVQFSHIETQNITLRSSVTIQTPPLNPVIPDPKEFIVAGILKRRWCSSKRQYQWLVKWLGYSEKENSWEPEESFKSGSVVNDIWKHFEECHPQLSKRKKPETGGPRKVLKSNK